MSGPNPEIIGYSEVSQNPVTPQTEIGSKRWSWAAEIPVLLSTMVLGMFDSIHVGAGFAAMRLNTTVYELLRDTSAYPAHQELISTSLAMGAILGIPVGLFGGWLAASITRNLMHGKKWYI